MKYRDLVYGEFEISEQVILELIASYPLQRLKKIDQGGYSKPFFPGKPQNRFDHSVGVFLLLKKFGASLEEQIAGLLHDISHTAFSHSIDYALLEGSQTEQNFQDKNHEKVLKSSGIPAILCKYGFDVDRILEEKNFPLKERNLPDLCADRIEYCLWDGFSAGLINQEDLNYFLNNLTVKNGNWIFKDFKSADKFAKYFLKTNRELFAGFSSALMFQTVGDYLKYSCNEKYITFNDFFTTDGEVIKKINKHLKKDKTLSVFWKRMNNQIKAKNNPNDFEARVLCKSRMINPFCRHRGKVVRISDIECKWKEIIRSELVPKEYFIKFEKYRRLKSAATICNSEL